MSYVRLGPYSALCAVEEYCGVQLRAYVLFPTKRLRCPDENRCAPIYYDYVQIVDALARLDIARAPSYRDDYLYTHARHDATTIMCGTNLYVTPALLKATFQLIIPALPRHASSLLKFLRREFQSTARAAAFGAAYPPPMDESISVLASPEYSNDGVAMVPSVHTLPTPEPDATAPPPCEPQTRKRKRAKTAPKPQESDLRMPDAPVAPTQATDVPSEVAACRYISAPYTVAAADYGGDGFERQLRLHMSWCVYLAYMKVVREETMVELVNCYANFLLNHGQSPHPSTAPSGRKRKAADADPPPV